MTTGLMAANWIKRTADDERKRDAARAHGEGTALRKDIVVDGMDAATGGFVMLLSVDVEERTIRRARSAIELVFAPDGAATLQIKIHRTGQVFTTADALSEYLMGPVFTGRPR